MIAQRGRPEQLQKYLFQCYTVAFIVLGLNPGFYYKKPVSNQTLYENVSNSFYIALNGWITVSKELERMWP
jgi:hypothetical protein